LTLPEHLKNLKKHLLFKYKIFTGEAKPNVIRLLPSLAITMEDAAILYATIEKCH